MKFLVLFALATGIGFSSLDAQACTVLPPKKHIVIAELQKVAIAQLEANPNVTDIVAEPLLKYFFEYHSDSGMCPDSAVFGETFGVRYQVEDNQNPTPAVCKLLIGVSKTSEYSGKGLVTYKVKNVSEPLCRQYH